MAAGAFVSILAFISAFAIPVQQQLALPLRLHHWPSDYKTVTVDGFRLQDRNGAWAHCHLGNMKIGIREPKPQQVCSHSINGHIHDKMAQSLGTLPPPAAISMHIFSNSKGLHGQGG